MKKFYYLVTVFILFYTVLSAQERYIHFNVEASGGYITSGHVPFWLRSNQFGSIPLDKASIGFTGRVNKEYNSKNHRFFDWGASVEGRSNIGYKTNFTLIEGYGKIRMSIFEIKAGRTKEITGLCDTSLSSGTWAVSGNALGIPKVQIGIPEFYSLPIFGKLFAFKGNYTHGWLRKTKIDFEGNFIQPETYLHQKSLYGKFGKPGWRLKLYGGFNHQALWCKEHGDIFNLSPVMTYLYVIRGRKRIGDHLGSIDLGFEYEFKNVRLFAYRQNIYDAGALYYLANIRDGLNGLSLVNIQNTHRGFQWRKMLIEVLYTKNQAGELWSKLTPSGDENYYNNEQYIEGWSYKGLGIGNPFISSSSSTRVGFPSDPDDYFINNRVAAFHFGFEGSVKEWDFILKTSYSLNYGTFGTSEVGHTLGKVRFLPRYGIFPETKQFSAYFETNKELKSHLNFGFVGAFDTGELYYNSFGMLFKLSKSF